MTHFICGTIVAAAPSSHRYALGPIFLWAYQRRSECANITNLINIYSSIYFMS